MCMTQVVPVGYTEGSLRLHSVALFWVKLYWAMQCLIKLEYNWLHDVKLSYIVLG